MFKQSFIPGFPEGAQRVGEALSILKQDGRVTYFVGGDNYFDPKFRNPDPVGIPNGTFTQAHRSFWPQFLGDETLGQSGLPIVLR